MKRPIVKNIGSCVDQCYNRLFNCAFLCCPSRKEAKGVKCEKLAHEARAKWSRFLHK